MESTGGGEHQGLGQKGLESGGELVSRSSGDGRGRRPSSGCRCVGVETRGGGNAEYARAGEDDTDGTSGGRDEQTTDRRRLTEGRLGVFSERQGGQGD